MKDDATNLKTSQQLLNKFVFFINTITRNYNFPYILYILYLIKTGNKQFKNSIELNQGIRQDASVSPAFLTIILTMLLETGKHILIFSFRICNKNFDTLLIAHGQAVLAPTVDILQRVVFSLRNTGTDYNFVISTHKMQARANYNMINYKTHLN